MEILIRKCCATFGKEDARKQWISRVSEYVGLKLRRRLSEASIRKNSIQSNSLPKLVELKRQGVVNENLSGFLPKNPKIYWKSTNGI